MKTKTKLQVKELLHINSERNKKSNINTNKSSHILEDKHKILIKVYKKLTSTYKTSINDYNIKQINDIIYNEKANIVSNFKDYLIFDDGSEFLKRFYKMKETDDRLPRLYDYYENYSKIFPNYIILPEAKYIYKNIQKKQKLIDTQQLLEAEGEKRLNDSLSQIFNTRIHDSIMNLSTSFHFTPFNLQLDLKFEENNEKNDNNERNINTSLENLILQINKIEEKGYFPYIKSQPKLISSPFLSKNQKNMTKNNMNHIGIYSKQHGSLIKTQADAVKKSKINIASNINTNTNGLKTKTVSQSTNFNKPSTVNTFNTIEASSISSNKNASLNKRNKDKVFQKEIPKETMKNTYNNSISNSNNIKSPVYNIFISNILTYSNGNTNLNPNPNLNNPNHINQIPITNTNTNTNTNTTTTKHQTKQITQLTSNTTKVTPKHNFHSPSVNFNYSSKITYDNNKNNNNHTASTQNKDIVKIDINSITKQQQQGIAVAAPIYIKSKNPEGSSSIVNKHKKHNTIDVESREFNLRSKLNSINGVSSSVLVSYREHKSDKNDKNDKNDKDKGSIIDSFFYKSSINSAKDIKKSDLIQCVSINSPIESNMTYIKKQHQQSNSISNKVIQQKPLMSAKNKNSSMISRKNDNFRTIQIEDVFQKYNNQRKTPVKSSIGNDIKEINKDNEKRLLIKSKIFK